MGNNTPYRVVNTVIFNYRYKRDMEYINEKDFTCNGYEMSDCCNAFTDTDILICSQCGEHCGVMCSDCEDTDECENK